MEAETKPESSQTPFEEKLDATTTSPEAKPISPALPFELIDKIWSYIEEKEKRAPLVCRLALVTRGFYEYFTSDKVWCAVPVTDTYYLLPTGGYKGVNRISSKELIHQIEYRKDRYHESLLPTEIWAHKKLLIFVLEKLKLECMPSKADYYSYREDLSLFKLTIEKLYSFDCLVYMFPEIFGADKNAILAVIKKFPEAIVYIKDSLLYDTEFMKEVVISNVESIKYLGDFRYNFDFLMGVSQTHPSVLKFAKGDALEVLHRITKVFAGSIGNRHCPHCRRMYFY